MIFSCVYVWVSLCVYTHTSHFLIHSSVNWNLGCFHVLVVINNAATNISIQVFLWDPTFTSFGYIPRNGITESHHNYIFNFWKTAIVFPIALHLPTVHKGSDLHIFTYTCIFLFFFFFFFDNRCLKECNMVTHCSFDLYSPDNH